MVQEVFIALWNNHKNLNRILSIRSFLYASVKNKCLNELKHIKVIDKYAASEMQDKEDVAFFTDNVIEEETHRQIYNAINELPSGCKEIVLLSIKGFKNSEIADRLNVSINTIKSQKNIAYRQLRFKLKYLLALSPAFFQCFLY